MRAARAEHIADGRLLDPPVEVREGHAQPLVDLIDRLDLDTAFDPAA